MCVHTYVEYLVRAEIWHISGVCNHEIAGGPGEPVAGGGDNQ